MTEQQASELIGLTISINVMLIVIIFAVFAIIGKITTHSSGIPLTEKAKVWRDSIIGNQKGENTPPIPVPD